MTQAFRDSCVRFHHASQKLAQRQTGMIISNLQLAEIEARRSKQIQSLLKQCQSLVDEKKNEHQSLEEKKQQQMHAAKAKIDSIPAFQELLTTLERVGNQRSELMMENSKLDRQTIDKETEIADLKRKTSPSSNDSSNSADIEKLRDKKRKLEERLASANDGDGKKERRNEDEDEEEEEEDTLFLESQKNVLTQELEARKQLSLLEKKQQDVADLQQTLDGLTHVALENLYDEKNTRFGMIVDLLLIAGVESPDFLMEYSSNFNNDKDREEVQTIVNFIVEYYNQQLQQQQQRQQEQEQNDQ